MKRREFIALTSTLPIAAASSSPGQSKAAPAPKPAAGTPQIPPIVAAPGPAYLLAGPMLGHLAENEVSIWVKSSKPAEWAVELADNADFNEPRRIDGGSITHESDLSSQIRIDRLQPSTRYFYRILFGRRVVSNLPAASFVTAPALGSPGKLRVAFSSCVGRLPEHSAAAWGEIGFRRNFDLFLMLGDNHYGDTTDLTRQRLYYTAHRMDAGFREFSARLPVYAIWDDHDYGPNDSDGTAQGKERSLKAFREFWANPPREEEPEDQAIYYHFQRGEIAFFMLDVRWHRSPNASTEPDKTMLGEKQLAWLKRSLKASPAKVKIIGSGSEWQTNGHKDSWASFLSERDALLEWMNGQKISGVVFVSGDRHFCAGYQILGRWVELTSGPLGSGNERNAKAVVKPETFTLQYDGKMWMILDIDTTTSQPSISYEIWGAGQGLIEQRVLTWQEIEGAAKITHTEKVMGVRASL